MSRLFTSGGQSIEASASASVLPMNIQGWFPLGLTGVISLQSQGDFSRVFSSATVQKHKFFSTQPSYGSTLTSIHDYWKNHSSDYLDLCWQSEVFYLAKWCHLIQAVPKADQTTHSFCSSTRFPPDCPAQGTALSFTHYPKPAAWNAFKVLLFPSVPTWHQILMMPLPIISSFLPPQLNWSFHNPRTPNSMKESESEVAKSCLTLYNPMDCSLPGSTIHGIFQARILEWVAISFYRRSSQPRD